MKKVSHRKETEVRPWTQSSNVDKRGNQDAIPGNVRYLGNILWNDYNTCTSNLHSKLRYRGIETVHIKVELLYDHGGTSHEYLT